MIYYYRAFMKGADIITSMDYTTAKEYIQNLQGRGIVLGLDTVKQLLKKLGNPEKSVPVIHIAGTNGKGSVGAYLSSVIYENGMNCARFVSPCVGEYQNTFLINGECVSQEVICDAMGEVKNAIDEMENDGVYPTQFIAETALAFVIFSRLKPDYAIIECGMGGKEDATNVVDLPVLSIITKISLDHTRFLGNTITEKAEQKAGIIKSTTPVVSAVQTAEVQNVIKRHCCNSELHIAENATIISADFDRTTFQAYGNVYTTHMLGMYQPQNASIAIQASRVLHIPENPIKKGIENAVWEYRCQRIGKFILDGAHNPDGAKALADSLKIYTVPKDTAFICACFKDKDYESIASLTAQYADIIYCISAPSNRGLDKDILCNAFKQYNSNSHTASSLTDAIDKLTNYKNVVIFGTLSILSNAKELIERSNNNATL